MQKDVHDKLGHVSEVAYIQISPFNYVDEQTPNGTFTGHCRVDTGASELETNILLVVIVCPM